MQCRESPLAKTPPANMANIPGVTSPGEVDVPKENGVAVPKPPKGVVLFHVLCIDFKRNSTSRSE